MEPVAVFDFDGTITRRDSMLAFLTTVVPAAKLYGGAVSLTPKALAYMLRVRDNALFKQDVLAHYFAGVPARAFERSALDFAFQRLPGLVRPAALDRMRWHFCEGHRVIIATASLEAYVRPWAVRNGIDDVVGTRLQVDGNGLLTGRLEGRNCFGPEKLDRLTSLLGDLGSLVVYAYGDGRGDRELLSLATYASYRPFRAPKGG